MHQWHDLILHYDPLSTGVGQAWCLSLSRPLNFKFNSSDFYVFFLRKYILKLPIRIWTIGFQDKHHVCSHKASTKSEFVTYKIGMALTKDLDPLSDGPQPLDDCESHLSVWSLQCQKECRQGEDPFPLKKASPTMTSKFFGVYNDICYVYREDGG